MFVIWGEKPVTSKGRFYCYQCKGEQEYQKLRMHNLYHVYFIPLFRGGLLGEWLTCSGCNNTFTMDALHGLTDEQRAERIALAMSILVEGISHLPIEATLLAEKVPVEQVEDIVKHALGREIRKCESCGGKYRPCFTTCGECKLPLSEPFQQRMHDFSDLVKKRD